MRIALFSDVHANLPALEAFFTDVAGRDTDAIYCLGDLVGYNVWPNEVINEIRKRGIPVIAGNYDDGVGRASDDCGCEYKTDDEKERGRQSIAYTNRIIGERERAYLRTLPSHLRLDFRIHDEPLSLLLVHGSPRRVNEYLFEDRDEKSMLRIMQSAYAEILCFGHTHLPFHRVIEEQDEEMRFRHAINTGSVGKPVDGDPRGSYVLITIDEREPLMSRDGISVEVVRFNYDIEKSAKAIEASDLPSEYAHSLRAGR